MHHDRAAALPALSGRAGGNRNWDVCRAVGCFCMAATWRTWKRRERWAWAALAVSGVLFAGSTFCGVIVNARVLHHDLMVSVAGGLYVSRLQATGPAPATNWNLEFRRNGVLWLPRSMSMLVQSPTSRAIGRLVCLPLWPVPVVSGAWAMWCRRARLKGRGGECPRCEYARAGLTGDAPCPECGARARV